MIKILRRKFNPEEGKPNPAQLVATFPTGMEGEAQACLARLQELSTSFTLTNSFQEFRYSIEKSAPPVRSASEEEGIQVDLSQAKRTVRPIRYTLSWHKEHGKCVMLAFNLHYGCIRGVVDDDPYGRKLFVRRISAVWPNAEQISK